MYIDKGNIFYHLIDSSYVNSRSTHLYQHKGTKKIDRKYDVLVCASTIHFSIAQVVERLLPLRHNLRSLWSGNVNLWGSDR